MGWARLGWRDWLGWAGAAGHDWVWLSVAGRRWAWPGVVGLVGPAWLCMVGRGRAGRGWAWLGVAGLPWLARAGLAWLGWRGLCGRNMFDRIEKTLTQTHDFCSNFESAKRDHFKGVLVIYSDFNQNLPKSI